MPTESVATLRSWIKTLPSTPIAFPISLADHLKYVIWKIYTPFHPFFRDLAIKLRILKPPGVQPFLLGTVASAEKMKGLINALIAQGFGNHFVAWKDIGEIASLRRIVNFRHQYHIRLFENGEVRGHYEYTPECRPFLHLKKVGQESRTDEFLKLIGVWLVPPLHK